jgi:hypothetical protein
VRKTERERQTGVNEELRPDSFSAWHKEATCNLADVGTEKHHTEPILSPLSFHLFPDMKPRIPLHLASLQVKDRVNMALDKRDRSSRWSIVFPKQLRTLTQL